MSTSPDPHSSAEREALDLAASAVVCDVVFPYEPILGNTAETLSRWAAAGYNFVSVHPAGDSQSAGEAVKRIAAARADLHASDDCQLVESVEDIDRAKEAGKLAVGLHLEGSNPLERDWAMVEIYHALGVRFWHPVFNQRNSFGGGCAEPDHDGMSRFGKRVLGEMNRLGIVFDGAHVGRQTTLDAIEASAAPTIFSHNGVVAVHEHFRNLTDEQICRCAEGGGVIGISGMNNYLGGKPTVDLFLRHVEHVIELVGPDHVGLGTDYVADGPMLTEWVRARPDEWPGEWAPFDFLQPEKLTELIAAMSDRGYGETTIRGILGGNFMRVFREVWA